MSGAGDPGPVAEEAARLFEALGAWAREHGSATGMGASLFEGVHSGISDGSPACRLCPVCQLIAVLRHARPETFAHLLDASTALTAALTSMVETSDGGGRSRDRRASGLQRIDLDPPGESRAAPA